ncbi:MAG: tetraacyldisaccharide 4'-kinase [Alphaproteobacteria bacterium]|nr:tetraacyldisaccharide 4'-kinase [Alphaproteobacteria bacterium]
MRAPEFWHVPSKTGRILSPLSLLWRSGTALRDLTTGKPWAASIPIVCIGNLTAGGAGKTPLAIDLARALLANRQNPHLLSRGYGSSLSGPILVDPKIHDASDVGDEPLLLAEAAPTWISRDRVAGAKQAIENGANLIIMDDGFQNPTLAKSFSILAIDGGYGFGNGRVIPAGPLRETVTSGLARSDAAVIIGEDIYDIAKTIGDACPVFRARIVAIPDPDLTDKKVFAFAGIARPSKFYATLQEMNCDIVGSRNFPDHHKFDAEEVIKICDHASQLGAIPVTTEKDYVRLPEEAHALIKSVHISLEWEEANAHERLLEKVLVNG